MGPLRSHSVEVRISDRASRTPPPATRYVTPLPARATVRCPGMVAQGAGHLSQSRVRPDVTPVRG
jgi:hypothetical protein